MKSQLVFLILTGILVSCGSSNNFQKKKYLNFKSARISEETVIASFEDTPNTDESQEIEFYNGSGDGLDPITSHATIELPPVNPENFKESETVEHSDELNEDKMGVWWHTNDIQPKLNDDEIPKQSNFPVGLPKEGRDHDKFVFSWIVGLYFFSAFASVFFFFPAIPFYLVALVLAINLRKRLVETPKAERTKKNKNRLGFLGLVMVQAVIGAIFGVVFAILMGV